MALTGWCGPGDTPAPNRGRRRINRATRPVIRLPVLQGVERDPLLNSHNQHTALLFVARSDDGFYGWFPASGRRHTECTRIVSIVEETLARFGSGAHTNQQRRWKLEFTSRADVETSVLILTLVRMIY